MNLLQKLAALFSSGAGAEPNVLWVYVRCDACGEVIASRINLLNDLSSTYGEGEHAYWWRKQLVGSSRGCYRPIDVELGFDHRRTVQSRQAPGGSFVSQEDYLAQQGEAEA